MKRLHVRDGKDWRVWLVGSACAYEVVALIFDDDRVPPLTRIAWKWREHRVYRFVLWLLIGWLIDHLFREGHD